MTEKHELDALRIELAEALGYSIEESTKNPGYFRILSPSLQPIKQRWYIDIMAAWRDTLPDWPRNAGDALALCLEIAQAKSVGIRIEHIIAPLMYVADFMAGNEIFVRGKLGATPAEALSRLALAAKRGGE